MATSQLFFSLQVQLEARLIRWQLKQLMPISSNINLPFYRPWINQQSHATELKFGCRSSLHEQFQNHVFVSLAKVVRYSPWQHGLTVCFGEKTQWDSSNPDLDLHRKRKPWIGYGYFMLPQPRESFTGLKKGRWSPRP